MPINVNNVAIVSIFFFHYFPLLFSCHRPFLSLYNLSFFSFLAPARSQVYHFSRKAAPLKYILFIFAEHYFTCIENRYIIRCYHARRTQDEISGWPTSLIKGNPQKQYSSERQSKRLSKCDLLCDKYGVRVIPPWQLVHWNLGISNIWVRCTAHEEDKHSELSQPKRSRKLISVYLLSGHCLLPFALQGSTYGASLVPGNFSTA